MKVQFLMAGMMALAAAACGSGEFAEEQVTSEDALRAGGEILALGDSITYGWNPYLTPVGQPTARYRSWVEELPGGAHVVNAACPGEASTSFFDSAAPDNNCRPNAAGDGPHYKRWLKTPWNTTTQAEFMARYLGQFQPKLVVLTLGGNDLFLIQEAGVWTLPSGASRYKSSMAEIFSRIARTGYDGVVAVPNVYALDYARWDEWAGIGMINARLASAASDANQAFAAQGKALRIVVADVHGAFKARANGGSSCAAGLLIPTPDKPGECDVHPSSEGAKLMAKTVSDAIAAAGF